MTEIMNLNLEEVTIKVEKLLPEKERQGAMVGKVIRIIDCEDCRELNGVDGKVLRDDDGLLFGTWHKGIPVCMDIDRIEVIG